MQLNSAALVFRLKLYKIELEIAISQFIFTEQYKWIVNVIR